MLMNKEQIKEIIPHREPFLLIDGIESFSEEENTIVGIKHVREDEYYFKGHFPEKKIMPGVLIIESLAQTGAVAILSQEKFRGRLAYFGGIKKARFPGMVVPGDDLVLQVALLRLGSRGGSARGKAVIKATGKTACECEFMFIIGKA